MVFCVSDLIPMTHELSKKEIKKELKGHSVKKRKREGAKCELDSGGRDT